MASKRAQKNVWIRITGRASGRIMRQCEGHVDARHGVEYPLWMRVVGPIRNRVLDILKERLQS